MAGRHGAKKQGMSARTRTIVRIGGTVAALAVVILAVSWFATPKTPAPVATGPGGGVVATQTAVATVTPSNPVTSTPAPSNPATGTPSTPVTPVTPPDTTTPLPAGIYATGIADLTSVVPKTFAGYDKGDVEVGSLAVIVPLQPNSSGPRSTVRIAVVSITDKGSESKAAAFVTGISKVFGKNASQETASSAHGTFGTDGAHVAAFRFARGRYVVEVLVTASSGSPLNQKAETLRLASLMPASQR